MNAATRTAILAALQSARDIADSADADGGRQLTDVERDAVTAHLTAAADLKKGAAAQDGLRLQMSELAGDLGITAAVPGADGAQNRGGRASVGAEFTASPEFQAMIASAPNGQFSEQARVQSAPYAVTNLITGLDHVTGAGTLLLPDHRGMTDPAYARPLTIRDLVTAGTTDTDVIEYVQLTSVTNAAAPVPEAVSSGPISTEAPIVTAAQAGLKPESGMVFAKQTANVKTIAHWLPATKRSLSDAAQIRTLIDAFLLYGLEEELEDQIIGGSGVGENFLGIGSVSGTQTQTPGVGDDIFSVARRGRTKVKLVGRAIPTAYVMHPNDWQRIELTRDAQERYYGAGPFAVTDAKLWGLPVVESEAATEGTAWVADWTKAVLYDRQQGSVQVTDSHADFFIRNLVAILAELRAAFAVLRPAAFCEITLPAP